MPCQWMLFGVAKNCQQDSVTVSGFIDANVAFSWVNGPNGKIVFCSADPKSDSCL